MLSLPTAIYRRFSLKNTTKTFIQLTAPKPINIYTFNSRYLLQYKKAAALSRKYTIYNIY
ncbi:MAG: hypothetical protein HFH66_11495 [Lachnospiraceae bacterium]|nr:hypothetical protein [Lachnospiraceae bacterium]